MHRLACGAMGALLGTFVFHGVAMAADNDVESDVRCLVVSMTAVGSADPETQKAGIMSGLFFMGRVEGQAPNLDLEGRLRVELPLVVGDKLKTEAVRCGALLSASGARMIAIGKSLKASPGTMPSL
jgi:hypothetical protein